MCLDRGELDNAGVLLKAMSNLPGKRRDFEGLIADYLAKPETLEEAHKILLARYSDRPTEEHDAVEFAPELREDLEMTELARVMLKAWDVSANLSSCEELSAEVQTTLERLFGLGLIGYEGQKTRYKPSIHEFESGAGVADFVYVLRPGVQAVRQGKTVTVFRAVVRADKEDPGDE